MNGSANDAPPAPAPSGPGRGRPKKVRPRENEAGSGTGIGAEVKRRRKSDTAGGETGELGARSTGTSDENETSVGELKDPVPPVTRSGSRNESHPMNKRKQNAVKGVGSDARIGVIREQGKEGEIQEEEKDTALDVVLEVHGWCALANGSAAAFPGEAGRETGGYVHLCACCMKPEVLKLTLVCDGCDKSFHITCLKLALQSANELDDWICASCFSAYPKSEVAAGVTKAVRGEIERRLFSQERRTSGKEGMANEQRKEVYKGVDNDQSVMVVAATSGQSSEDLNEINGPNVIGGDQHKHSSTEHRVLSERPSLDLNKVNDEAAAGSSGRKLAIDLNECRAPEFEDDVLMVDLRSKSPEAEGGAVYDLVLPAIKEPCAKSISASLELSVSKSVEASEAVQWPTTEEFLGVTEDVLPGARGSFAVLHAEVPSNAGEYDMDGTQVPTGVKATPMVQVKPAGTPEDSIITSSSRSTVSTDFQVENEKKLPVAEELINVADSKFPITLEKLHDYNKGRSTDFTAEFIGGNSETLAGHSVAEPASEVEIKLLESAESEILSRSRSVIPSTEHSADEINQACTVGVSTDADNAAACAAVGVIGALHGAADFGKCITGDDRGEDGELSITKQLDKKEKRVRKNENKVVEHVQEHIVVRPEITRERVEISEPELASHNALPTIPVVGASPSSSTEMAGIEHDCQQSQKTANKVAASSVSCADKASCTNVGLNGSLTGQPAEVTSPLGSDDQQQLKKIGADTLQQLRDSVREKHGVILADGWEVEVRKRRNEKHLDKYYISPEKHRFRSRIEVMKHLGLWDGSKCSPQDGSKVKCEAQQSQPREWWSTFQQVTGANAEVQLPLKLGELTLESLGVIDLRPGYWDEQHIWPVGYRCTWHDRTTSSFCVSEVADGGSAGPIFRVTRRYCPTVVGLTDAKEDVVNIENGSSGIAMRDLQIVAEDIMAASVTRMSSCSQSAKTNYGNFFDIEEEDSLKALLGDISFPSAVNDENEKLCQYSRNLEEMEKIRAEIVSQDCGVFRPRDVVGEFSVEAFSTAEAWKLYAEKFVERCGNVSDVFGSVLKPCCHNTAADGGSLPTEAPDPKSRLEKLGEDRFGLNQTLVVRLIETLYNSDNCAGYKSFKERGLSWKAGDPVVATVQPPRFRIREKARKQKKSLEVLVEERAAAAEHVEVRSKDEVDGLSSTGERPPPPPGQCLEVRLPSQHVGDVLQIWEFLCRFSSLIGLSQPPALEELEEELTHGSANVRGYADQSDSLHTSSEIRAFNRKPESGGRLGIARDVGISHMAPASATCETIGSPRTPLKKLLPGRTHLASSVHVSQRQDAGRMERLSEDDGMAVGSASTDSKSLMDIEHDHCKGEALSADIYPKLSEAKVMDESGLASAASVHVPLIKFLLADLQSKVCGFEEVPGESDESKQKRGRKRIRDAVASACLGREKLTDSFSVNDLTWPEVARRYIISLSRIKEIGETAEYGSEECMKILRCIQGDGGVLCGALDGVAGMEIDAQLLAEAEKEISTLMHSSEETAAPTTPPQNGSSRDSVEVARGEDSSGECALWVKLLDPIAKLPTNVGSRIRNRVIDALAANPPAWAAEMLEYSISKKVYKGNASGPTKRAVMEVLQRYRGGDPLPKVKKTKKQRKRVLPSSEVVMQRCRIVLRQVATADALRVVSRSYRCITNFYESDGEDLLARPLDFRAIDLRLGAGAYGISPDAFAADMNQIWKNVASLNEHDSVEASAGLQLAELFHNLYNKQVTVFQKGGDQAAVTAPERLDGKMFCLSNEGSEKNATDQNSQGADANKPVRAPWEDDSCQVCGIDDDHDNVLLCDGCDAEYHIYCLNPPLPEVPDGNWFCHSCVAVDTGFLEAPSAPESATEIKPPDKQQDHHQMREHLEEVGGRDQLRRSSGSTFSPLRAVVLKLAATDYWHLTLAERIQLLKWLCDQALETPKLRSHVHRSMEIALELQQDLRTLLAERRKNTDSDETTRPERVQDGTKDVGSLSMFQSRGAISSRPDESHADISVRVDVVDSLSVLETSPGTAGTSGMLKSDPTGLLGPEEFQAGEMVRRKESNYNLKSARHLGAEHEQQVVATKPSRRNLVVDPVEVNLPNPVVTRNGHQLERPGGATRVFHSETNLQSLVLDAEDLLFADSSKVAGVPVPASDQVFVEARNQLSTCEEGLESRMKCPKDEPFLCPEVEVQIANSTSQKNTSSFLDAEIEKVKTKLMLLNGRRDLLGRDDTGRVYWALCGSKTTPWLAVETADARNASQTEDQEGLAAGGVRLSLGSSALRPSMDNVEKDGVLTKRDPSSRLDESPYGSPTDVQEKEAEGAPSTECQRRPRQELSWHIYSDEHMLDQLTEWLSPRSNQERLLKATLLQWKSLLLLYKGGASEQAGHVQDLVSCSGSRGYGLRTVDTQALGCSNVHKDRRYVMPALKATSLLEWKFGQFSDTSVKTSSTSGGSKRGRKRKTQQSSKILHCDCLEPFWASRCHCMLCHTSYETEVEFQAHTTGGSCNKAGGKRFDQQGDVRSGKKSCHNSKPLPVTKFQRSAFPQQSPAGVLTLPDVSKMPMVVHESLRDRINGIGFIAGNGPLFTPGLAISPVFDPALMMVDSLVIPSSAKAGRLANAKLGIFGALPVGATTCTSPSSENLVNGYRMSLKGAEDLTAEVEFAEARVFADLADNRTSMAVAECPVQTHAGPLSLDVKGLSTKVEVLSIQNQPAISASALGSTLPSTCDLPDETDSNPSQNIGHGKTFRVTGKQLTIPEASLRPLEDDEDLNVLQQLKVKLLDIEAAITQDMSEKARAYPLRRQAWRSMLKMATSIYTVVQAIILLEQMIRADFLRTSWCYWSSLTVAAKTATLSSLFLRIYALDAAIVYEKSETYSGADLTNLESKQGREQKEDKHCPFKPPRKKKKEEVIVVP